MAYFPLLIDLGKKRVLVVGAGTVAARKIEKLLGFGPRIDVIAKTALPEVRELAAGGRLKLEEREFRLTDLEGAALVIVAADDLALQKQVFEECARRAIPCNSVDSPEHCSFIFPALIQREDLVISINTGGKAPGLSAELRRLIESVLPANLERVLAEVARARKDARQKSLSTYEQKKKRIERLIARLLPRR